MFQSKKKWPQRPFSTHRNIRTRNKSSKRSLCVSSANQTSQCEKNVLHGNHALHVNLNTGVWNFWKNIFSVEVGRKIRVSKTCEHLSLVLGCPRWVWHCTVFVVVIIFVVVVVVLFSPPFDVLACPCWVDNVLFFLLLQSFDVVLLDTINVYLSLSSGRTLWCC